MNTHAVFLNLKFLDVIEISSFCAGVGKSSTINHMFNATVAPVSSVKSKTKATTEYILKKDDEKMGVKDLTLGIIDTPGEKKQTCKRITN